MNNLSGPDKYMREKLKTGDRQSNSDDNPQKIYSNCVSTHDDVCFLDIEDSQN